jgi:hypothetical protein
MAWPMGLEGIEQITDTGLWRWYSTGCLGLDDDRTVALYIALDEAWVDNALLIYDNGA